MFSTVASLACGLAVLSMGAANAQGDPARQIQTLWQGQNAQVLKVYQGQWTDVQQQHLPHYQKMVCATDNKSHYLIGQVKNQYLEPWLDVDPSQMQYLQNHKAVYFKSQAQQGPFKGAVVQGVFQQTGPKQITAQFRVTQMQHGQQPYDYIIGTQMQMIWQQQTPNTPEDTCHHNTGTGTGPVIDPGIGNGDAGFPLFE
jgi:hypothetical protein